MWKVVVAIMEDKNKDLGKFIMGQTMYICILTAKGQPFFTTIQHFRRDKSFSILFVQSGQPNRYSKT